MSKKRVVHYTIGFHYPYRGGVETDIGNTYNMTKDKYDHIVVCKNGGALYGDLLTVSSVGKQGRSTYCQNYKDWYVDGILPKSSPEFDEYTVDIINNLKPDILIGYGSEGIEKLIPLLECKASRKFLKTQAVIGYEMEVLAQRKHNIELICYNPNDMYKAREFMFMNDIHYIPFAYDDSVFNSYDREPYIKGNTIKCLYTGRVAPGKNTLELVSVFNRLINEDKRDIILNIVGGSFDPPYFDLVKKKISTNNISILPWLDHSELSDMYKQHTISVIPSFFEAFCASALESLACGCITVMNNTYTDYWAKKYVVNGCHLGHEKPSEETLYTAMNYALDNIEFLLNKDFSEQIYYKHSFSTVKRRWLEVLNG